MFATDVEDKCVKEKWLVHLCILLLCSVEDGKQKTVALWKIGLRDICAGNVYRGSAFAKRKYI